MVTLFSSLTKESVPAGRLPIKSCVRRAGIVIDPSSSIFAPMVSEIAMSRFVVDISRRLFDVLRSMFARIGRLFLAVAMRATVDMLYLSFLG